MQEDTRIVRAGRDPAAYQGAVNPPVYHVSTVTYPSLAAMHEAHLARERDEQVMVYGRTGTPTSFALETALAEIEGGYRCVTFPSGLAAISTTLLAFLKTGDHLLMVDSVYGPSRAFCNGMLKRMGIETSYYDPTIGAGIKALLRPNTAVVFVESPGSLTFEMQDIPGISAVAHAAGATVIMDNTWASPLYFKAFEHGVDVSIQAATKYVVGHSDAMLGSATATEAAWPKLRAGVRQMGQSAGPDDLYLAQRGLRTLAVRLERHHASGLAIADWLRSRPEVARVLHPGLPGDPGHQLWRRNYLGASGLFSFELKPCSIDQVAAMLDHLELFGLGYSWGGYESLAIHAEQAKLRTETRWDSQGQLIRLHIGLEGVDDLKADLTAGFERLRRAG